MAKKAKKMMRGGLAQAAGRVPPQAGAGMAQAAGARRPVAMPAQVAARTPGQAGAGVARATGAGPRRMKTGGKIDGAAKKGKTKGRKC